MWKASDANARNLIHSGAPLMLANDGAVSVYEILTDPKFSKVWIAAPAEDNLRNLATGHFFWFRAMEEKKCPPMEMLKAATKNIAVAYGQGDNLGTLEKGKFADILILDKDPLQSAENYQSIHMILKEGVIVDREALPDRPVLTRPAEPVEEENSFVPFLSTDRVLSCPTCVGRNFKRGKATDQEA